MQAGRSTDGGLFTARLSPAGRRFGQSTHTPTPAHTTPGFAAG